MFARNLDMSKFNPERHMASFCGPLTAYVSILFGFRQLWSTTMIKGTNETQIVVGLDLASPYGMVCVFGCATTVRVNSSRNAVLSCRLVHAHFNELHVFISSVLLSFIHLIKGHCDLMKSQNSWKMYDKWQSRDCQMWQCLTIQFSNYIMRDLKATLRIKHPEEALFKKMC